MITSLEEVCGSLLAIARQVAGNLNRRISLTLEEVLTYAPFCQTEEEAESKIRPAIYLLIGKYHGYRGAAKFKVSGGDEPFYVAGSTKSGIPRLLIMAAVFEAGFRAISSEVQDSGKVNSINPGYTSVVGVYALSRRV